MYKFLKIVFLFVTFTSSVVWADNSQYEVFNNKPINVMLKLGVKKLVKFQNPVQIGIPTSLKGKLVVENVAGEVSLTAIKPFPKGRLEIRDNNAGKVLLVDIVISGSGSSVPLSIFYQQPNIQKEDVQWSKTPDVLTGEMAYVTLTRYAEQALYAPKRLITNPYGIQLVDSYQNPGEGVSQQNSHFNLFYDNSTVNVPWATWKGGDTYVTAIVVRNQLNIPLNLSKNIPLICGRDSGLWQAVTFFPSWTLGKAGSSNDSTVALLVSKMPYSDVKRECENNG